MHSYRWDRISAEMYERMLKAAPDHKLTERCGVRENLEFRFDCGLDELVVHVGQSGLASLTDVRPNSDDTNGYYRFVAPSGLTLYARSIDYGILSAPIGSEWESFSKDFPASLSFHRSETPMDNPVSVRVMAAAVGQMSSYLRSKDLPFVIPFFPTEFSSDVYLAHHKAFRFALLENE